jgi:N-acetylmuramoyl-L-alanine amidase
LDLTGPAEISVSQLANPDRLIVDLRSKGPATSASAAPTMEPGPSSIPAAAVRSEPLKPEPVVLTIPVAMVPPPTASPVVTAAALPAPLESEPFEIAKPARRTTEGGTSLVRTLGLKVRRVVIDPGHGGHDQGTEGGKGLLEKDLVLDVSLRLGKLIQEDLGADVVYTRSDDTFIPLEGRTALANERKADLFLSVHANSSPSTPQISGVETYYLNFTDNKDSMAVATRENATSQKSIFDLRDIIQAISQHDKAAESREFAAHVQAALYAFSSRNFPTEKNRGVKKAEFVVLVGASMPSVLAEIGFLSNPKEEALLKKSEYRQKLAEAIYHGVSKYAESLSHFQVAQK